MPTTYPTTLDDYGPPHVEDETVEPGHVNDLEDAMEAVQGELGTIPSGAAANVAARLDAIDTEVASKASESALATHIADPSAAHAAAAVSFAAAGGIIATNVQAALEELDAEKAAASHNHDDRYYTETEANGRFQPLAPNLVAPYDPRAAVGLNAFGIGDLRTIRVIVPKTGTLRDFAVYIGTSSGNLSAAVYDTAATRARLWTTGAIASPGTGWQILGDPALAVTAGDQLDFALSADNATATFGRMSSAAGAVNSLPAVFWPAGGAAPKIAGIKTASHPAPATISEATLGLTSVAVLMIARVE